MSELTVPSTVRTLTGSVDTHDLVEAMAERLPEGGMAAPRMGRDHHLARATWQLLDSRILAVAAEILDVDALRPLASCLADYERVRKAADRTTTPTDTLEATPEATVALFAPQPLVTGHEESVQILVEGRPAATVRFRLDVTAKLGESSLVVRLGQIAELACQLLTLSASLQLIGWSTPLWESPTVSLPEVHLTLQPPVPVPRPPRPRASTEDSPRPISGRPPVPRPA